MKIRESGGKESGRDKSKIRKRAAPGYPMISTIWIVAPHDMVKEEMATGAQRMEKKRLR
jgi:hypothetical protein